jgi:hypothetical protein
MATRAEMDIGPSSNLSSIESRRWSVQLQLQCEGLGMFGKVSGVRSPASEAQALMSVPTATRQDVQKKRM